MLQEAPGFDGNALQTAQANWDTQIRQYWQKQNVGAGSSTSGNSAAVVRMTRLEGAPVLDASRQEVGEFPTALVNLNDGSLRYGVVSYGGTLGIGERQIAVPMSHFNATSEQGFLGNEVLALRLDVLQSKLQNAPSFNTNATGETGWENQVSNFWQNLTAGQ